MLTRSRARTPDQVMAALSVISLTTFDHPRNLSSNVNHPWHDRTFGDLGDKEQPDPAVAKYRTWHGGPQIDAKTARKTQGSHTIALYCNVIIVNVIGNIICSGKWWSLVMWEDETISWVDALIYWGFPGDICVYAILKGWSLAGWSVLYYFSNFPIYMHITNIDTDIWLTIFRYLGFKLLTLLFDFIEVHTNEEWLII